MIAPDTVVFQGDVVVAPARGVQIEPVRPNNDALHEIAERKPRNLNELAQVQGVGATKLERYGEAMLAALTTNG